jgi:hypothetical protein
MTTQTTQLTSLLKTDSGIDPGYRHAPKRASPGEPLEPSGSVLKWYALHPEDRPVPDDIDRLARNYLLETQLEARGLGFVILHRCGHDFYFLLLSTWRQSNELWETVLYKNDDAMPDFAPFPRDGAHKPLRVYPGAIRSKAPTAAASRGPRIDPG